MLDGEEFGDEGEDQTFKEEITPNEACYVEID